ncbi:hypothetical protein [Kribbella monticola]|uniref:hypothetical protein n=1 Tax=Kribbella monticola TaxID=2185285 RepID=UPI00130042AF|nr:hypothetical protein [Kribbella monticola]
MTAAAPEPSAVPDVDGVWFQLVRDDPSASTPYGQYHREDDLVWAEFYAGGSLRSGRLVGRMQPDGTIRGAYCLLTADGELVSGECRSIPEYDLRGNIRITDHFRRSDGTRGVSSIEQIPAPIREV